MNAKVKITVLKRLLHKELLEKFAESVWPPCERLSEGQEFVSESVNMPDGFCSWAWADIQKYVMTLSRGGNFRGTKPGVFITCCTDGYRPVIFKLERIN
ncbi:MAG: TIGR04076 family protein [Sedimentisphaerales bacterium]